jgi:histidine triad (HIT) family protein
VSTSDCIFCKIAAGELASLRVLETPDALAFLDIGPLAPGHTLLIPKKHYENILDVPPDVLASMTSHLPRMADALMRVTGAAGMNILQNTGKCSGQVIFHLHIHLIPRVPEDGLGYRWNAGQYGQGEGEALQAKILDELGK